PDVLRNDGLATDLVDRDGVHRVIQELHGVVVDLDDVVDVAECSAGAVTGERLVPLYQLPGKDDVIGSEVLTVVPLDALAELHGQDSVVLIEAPAGRQPRLRLVLDRVEHEELLVDAELGQPANRATGGAERIEVLDVGRLLLVVAGQVALLVRLHRHGVAGEQCRRAGGHGKRGNGRAGTERSETLEDVTPRDASLLELSNDWGYPGLFDHHGLLELHARLAATATPFRGLRPTWNLRFPGQPGATAPSFLPSP